jgi:hypothetical protein
LESLDRETLDYDILQCIDRGLGKCGSSIKHATYWQLLIIFNMKASDIPTHPEEFSNALEKIFGSGGGVMIERAIVQELKSEFQIERLQSTRFVQTLEQIRGRTYVIPVRTGSCAAMSRDGYTTVSAEDSAC